MSAKIATVVVTFNRLALLEKTLAALAKQTVAGQTLFVVDNATTDGTTDFLSQYQPKVSHIQLATNVGAAGGYHIGVKTAYESGADFIWAMDDDVVPDPDALERLLKAHDLLVASGVDAGFLNSRVFAPSGDLLNVPDVDTRPSANGYSDWGRFAHLGIIKIRCATFVSILIPKSTIVEFGLPIPEMYIWGEDTEYTLRISQEKPGYLVAGSQVTHARAGNLNLLEETSPTRIGNYYYFYRNQISIARRFHGRRGLLWQLYGFGKHAARALYRGEFEKLKVIMNGVWSGLWFTI
jgi:dTDP-4-dehydrorhamnose reductase